MGLQNYDKLIESADSIRIAAEENSNTAQKIGQAFKDVIINVNESLTELEALSLYPYWLPSEIMKYSGYERLNYLHAISDIKIEGNVENKLFAVGMIVSTSVAGYNRISLYEVEYNNNQNKYVLVNSGNSFTLINSSYKEEGVELLSVTKNGITITAFVDYSLIRNITFQPYSPIIPFNPSVVNVEHPGLLLTTTRLTQTEEKVKELQHELDSTYYPFLQMYEELGGMSFYDWSKAFQSISIEKKGKDEYYYGVGIIRLLEESNTYRVAIYPYTKVGDKYVNAAAGDPMNIFVSTRNEVAKGSIENSNYGVKITYAIDFSCLPLGDYINRFFIFSVDETIGTKLVSHQKSIELLGDLSETFKNNISQLQDEVFNYLPSTYPFIKDYGILGDKTFDEWGSAFKEIYVETQDEDEYYYGVGVIRMLEESKIYRVSLYPYYKVGDKYSNANASNPITILADSRDAVKEGVLFNEDYNIQVRYKIDFSKLPSGDYMAGSYIFADNVYKLSLKEKVDTLTKNLEKIELSDDSLTIAADSNRGLWMNKRVLTVRKPGVEIDNITNFDHPFDAVDSITDASETNPYEVQLYDDFYAYQKSDYKLRAYNSLCYVKNYVTLRGMGERKILYAELPDNLELTDYQNYQTMQFDGGGTIENLHVIAWNVRYPIHFERGNGKWLLNQNTRSIVRNCVVEHRGAYGGSPYKSWDAWGSGCGQGLIIEFYNSNFIGRRNGIRIHTNSRWDYPNRYLIDGCNIYGRQYAILLDDYNSLMANECVIRNSNINGAVYISSASTINSVPITECFKQYKISGGGNSLMHVRINYNTLGLRITSLSKGLSSDVTLIQDAGIMGKTHKRKGNLEVASWVNGEICVSKIDNLFGEKLGDCSDINKILVLSIDGEEVSIVFDKNYMNLTNTEILKEINEKLTNRALATFDHPASYYYPELAEVLYTKSNETQRFIPKGVFVKFTGLYGVRVIKEGEIPDGYTLDDISIGERGRIVNNLITIKNSKQSPLFKDSDSFVEGDRFNVEDGMLVKDPDSPLNIVALSDSYLSIRL